MERNSESNIWIFIRNRRFIDERDYLAGVAAPASLLTHRVRGCNEIYEISALRICCKSQMVYALTVVMHKNMC